MIGRLLERYLAAVLVEDGAAAPPERGREGYTLRERYLAALLGVRLPVRDRRRPS